MGLRAEPHMRVAPGAAPVTLSCCGLKVQLSSEGPRVYLKDGLTNKGSVDLGTREWFLQNEPVPSRKTTGQWKNLRGKRPFVSRALSWGTWELPRWKDVPESRGPSPATSQTLKNKVAADGGRSLSEPGVHTVAQ